MRRHAFLPTLALAATLAGTIAITIPAATAHAQTTLQAQPSGRARSEVNLVPPSGQATSAQPATIMIDYGQPHLRGRTLHTGDLVPYDQPWRTGANAATMLTTGVNLRIGGVDVPAGRYVVYTLPTRNQWTLILQRTDAEPGMMAAMQYDQSKDSARIPLQRRELRMPIESLTMWLIPATGEGAPRGELRIMWGNTELSTSWEVR